MDLRPAPAILDVGCGDGSMLEAVSRFGPVQGVEPDSAVLPDSVFSKWTIHRGPFDKSYRPETQLDLILMLDVIEHMDEPHEALKHAKDLLAPNGKVIVTVPAFQYLWTVHDDYNQHRLRYTAGQLASLLQDSGFLIEHCRYFYHWLFFAKIVQVAKEKIFKPSGKDIPGLPFEPVNRFLCSLSWNEYRLTRSVNLPFGSSILAIAAVPEA